MKEYKLKIGSNSYQVEVQGIEDSTAKVSVNGVEYNVEIEGLPQEAAAPVAIKPVAVAPRAAVTSPAPAAAPSAAPKAAGGKSICSPLPGVIIGLDVKEGSVVKRGQRIAVLEAMKMENDILAEADGTISAVLVSKGDSVLEGAPIVSLS